MTAIWTDSIRARDEAGRLAETDHGRDDGLEHGISSGAGAQRSELGYILKEEPQDLLVSCGVCEKDKSGMHSSSLAWATG